VPQLTVLIPVAGRLEYFEDTLLSVLETQPEDCRVMVVLDEPYADPYGLKQELRFIEAGREANLTQAIQLALLEVETPVTFILPSGHELEPGWAEAPLRLFDDDRIAAVVPVVVRHNAPDVIVAAGLGYRQDLGRLVPLQAGVGYNRTALSRRTQVLPHPAGAFFRTDCLRSLPLDEGLGDGWVLAAVARGLHAAGYLTVLEPTSRIRAREWPQPTDPYHDAHDAEVFFWRWWGGPPPLPVAARHMREVLGSAAAALTRGEFWAELSGRISGARNASRQVAAHGRHELHGPHFRIGKPRCAAVFESTATD